MSEFDLGAINSRIAALLPAGFYYKTFKWPNWHLFEPTIRRMAGLGRASAERDPDRYEEIAAQAEVLVVGGGIAGLERRGCRGRGGRGHAAARERTRARRRVGLALRSGKSTH